MDKWPGHTGQLTEDKRSACTEFSWPQLSGSGDKNVFPSRCRKDAFHGGALSLAFRKKGEVRAPFSHLLFFKCP